MPVHAHKPHASKTPSAGLGGAHKQKGNGTFQVEDNRPEAAVQRKRQEVADGAATPWKGKTSPSMKGIRATIVSKSSAQAADAPHPVQRSVDATVGRNKYSSADGKHAEEALFESGNHDAGDFTVDMNAWPCTGEHRGHDCHDLFKRKSAGRKITLNVTADHAGYAANHRFPMGTTGTIIYDNGAVSYSNIRQPGGGAAAAAAAAAVQQGPPSAYDDPSTSRASRELIDRALTTETRGMVNVDGGVKSYSRQYPPKKDEK